ncbi:MAG TPA: conjugative transfer signal peptidase TraF [Bryobacteraceae bacterium]|nr:conjugative transfer signal peptidase TraF [Bryobacteraceae bacterium]
MILRGRLARLSGIVPAAVVIAGIGVTFQLGGIRVNASSSLPIGLYRTTSDKSARLIGFCPMEPFASMSASRGYRKKGNCQDGAEPLMKPVVAAEGDTVEISSEGVSVNGTPLPNSTARPFDTKNRPLTHWPFGKYRVGTGTVWVISSFNIHSFDSRYFGPVPIASIRCYLRPLLTE